MTRRPSRTRPASRGVAQIEFVVNLPLILLVLGLAVCVSALLVRRTTATIAARQTVVPATAPAVRDAARWEAAAPLQVPARFRVLGEDRIRSQLQPIAALAGPADS